MKNPELFVNWQKETHVQITAVMLKISVTNEKVIIIAYLRVHWGYQNTHTVQNWK